MRNDPTVIDLVLRARSGDASAWDDLVERFAPLVWAVCRRYGLSGEEADDVGQNVWLALLTHLPALREPAALAGWLTTTTRHECLHALRLAQRRRIPGATADAEPPDLAEVAQVEDLVLIHERNVALRAAFSALPVGCRQLLGLLAQDPPLSYVQIGERLGLPVGGLGPRRARCLDKLRRSPELAALIDSDASRWEGGERARPELR
jgi:RNA polymerase sigma factor (sigma-70 family)